MTSANSITNKRPKFMPLFNFSARQFWTTTLLFTIILFFVLPIPVMMIASQDYSYMRPSDIPPFVRKLTEWSKGIRFAVVPIISAFAVIVSCARFAYLKNKVSVDFYHSIPVKRGQLYLTQIAVGALSILIAYVINLILTLNIIAVYNSITAEIIYNIIIMCAETAVYASFFHALSTLVGMISGLTSVQIILTAVATFIVPVVHALSVTFIGIFNEYFWDGWYLKSKILEKTSPVLRFVITGSPLSITEAIVFIIATVALFVGAYYIYLYRKSERAGTPVVFKPLGEVIKYILVYIGSLLLGLFFYGIMNSAFWTVFGLAFGALLVFMLTNTILHKTAKAMFRGWKGLCAYFVVGAICFTLLMTNAFGINTNVPSPAMTSRVEVSFQNTIDNLEFSERENIEALYNIYTKSKNFSYTTYSPVMDYESFRLHIVFYPKVGFPIAKSIYVNNKSDMIDDFRTLLDSEEFSEQYSSRIDLISSENGNIAYGLPWYYFGKEDGRVYREDWRSKHISFDKLDLSSPKAEQYALEQMKADTAASNFEFFQTPTLSVISVYFDDIEKNVHYQLNTSMSSTLDHLLENELISYTYDELIDNLAEHISSITVYKITENAEEKRTIKNKDKIREILLASANPISTFGATEFTFADTEYYAVYEMEVVDVNSYYYEEDDEMVYVTIDEEIAEDYKDANPTKQTRSVLFLAGKVPAFVIDMFN